MAQTERGAGNSSSLQAQIQRLSAGYVGRITPAGPRFVQPMRLRRPRPTTFVATLAPRDRVTVMAIAVGWAVTFIWFWTWWLTPEHRVGWPALIINSTLLLYLTALPGYFLTTVARLRHVNPALSIPDLSVAFVVTRAPSEHWSTVRRTVEAMLAQDLPLPYDVWLCDEEPSPEIVQWCDRYGVLLSSRRDAPDYHRATWPRRTRCKEGNLAYFYDRWGYQNYAVVAQLDCDHVPTASYLSHMVRPFRDPAIGYVAAPSMCDANAATSWSARGRLHREAIWHGAVQLGHSDGLAPMCIGSHYAVRTRALRDIGGLGPELAEDFSTTFLLNSAGWQGAFAIDAEAHGDGPLTFADMVTQEFQWSRSLTTVLLELLPHHLRRMPGLLRLRFAYALAYYPLLGLSITAGLALPPIAVLTGLPWMDINYFDFLLHFWLLPVWVLITLYLMRRRGLLRPRSAPILSWETWLFALARWPYVIWGVLAAVWQRLVPRTVVFKVTPKTRGGMDPLLTRLVIPFALLALGLSAVALWGELKSPAAGYVFLCLLGSLAYAVVGAAVPALHVAETARATGEGIGPALRSAWLPLLTGIIPLPVLGLAITAYPPYAAAVLGW